jgi:phospholipase C
MDSRREFLKKASLLTGAAGLFSVLPDSIQKALAIDPRAGTTWQDAEHIVILMQENRSFDHCYGTLNGVRGFNDPRAIQLPNKNPVWLQSNAAGETYAPFRLDMKDSKATWMSSLPHSWKNQVNARNDGKHDQWLNEKRNSIPEYSNMPLTMGYYNREDIPFYYALADAFTVCDQHFCSSLTGTNPNRLFFWSGTIREEQHERSRAHVWNEDNDYGTIHWKTFPERLEEQGISWKFYQNELSIDVGFDGEQDGWLSNFQDNPLEFFAQYQIRLHEKHLQHLEKKGELTAQQVLDLRNTFNQLSETEKSLHRKAFTTNTNDPFYHELEALSYDDGGTGRSLMIPKGDILHQFREDVGNGKLPTVSWLAAPENFSDHPSSAWFGAWYVSEVLDILTKNPEVWKKTIFILTYDENDGYFDHVAPFTAPNPHKTNTGVVSKGIDTRVEFVTLQQERDREGFPEKFERENSIGLGFRVPLVIASPWSRGGWVNSQVFDHTSTLQFLETFLSKKTGKKIEESNISDWRRTVCGNLTSVFRPYNGEQIENPAFLSKDPFIESIHKAKFKSLPAGYKRLTETDIAAIIRDPSTSLYMPRQEKGKRPSAALPYELYADGGIDGDRKSFSLKLEARRDLYGKEAAGCPFNVYAPGKYLNDFNRNWEEVRTWAYAVSAGDQILDSWPLDHFENDAYHLRVYGPNGFFREFTGNVQDPSLDISCEYQRNTRNNDQFTGNIILKIQNLSTLPYPVEIIERSYKKNHISKTLGASGKLQEVLDLSSSFGWYDFSVRLKGLEAFEKRYAGRVETGRSGFSDPLLG